LIFSLKRKKEKKKEEFFFLFNENESKKLFGRFSEVPDEAFQREMKEKFLTGIENTKTSP